jgi:hypothetical protein
MTIGDKTMTGADRIEWLGHRLEALILLRKDAARRTFPASL